MSYREAAVQGASPMRLVVLLYEQAIEDLRRALAAHERADVEGRTRNINHAILVIGHLQATLDKGLGRQVAANLERFYGLVRAGLVEAQCGQSGPLLEQQISHLLLIQEAWRQVERAISPSLSDPAEAAGPALVEREGKPAAEWNA
jgi:flagellar secretion chaperone FliS